MGFSRGPKIVTDGLVLALDAANSKSYPGSGNTWYDLSGNGRNFTWSTATWNSEGYFSTSSGQIATGPASNSFGIDNSSGYTIFLAFKTNAATSNAAFKFVGSVSSNRGIFLHPGWTNDTLYFDQGGGGDSSQRLTYVNSNIVDSGLYNVVTLRSTVATRSIFYNGTKVANTTTTAANIDLNSTGVMLGNVSDEAYTWNGNLAAFYVYDTGLTDDECIQTHIALKSRFGV